MELPAFCGSPDERIAPVFSVPEGGALVYNTKSSPPPYKKFVKTSISPLSFDSPSAIKRARWDRYRLLSVVRKIMNTKGAEMELEFPANFHRTAKCNLVAVKGTVDVHKSIEHGKAFYSGLSICGDVWNCPVCSAKIQERRRQEVSQAVDWAYKNGFKCIMVTFTMPHTLFDAVKGLLDSQKNAFVKLRKGKAWDQQMASVGFEGLIRSLELTYGFENGWHPHTHELWIVRPDTDISELRSFVVNRWYESCVKSGVTISNRSAFFMHSVDIVDNASNSDYLAKMDDEKNWGIDRELVKGNSKNGLHPFGILDRIFNGETELINLFLEYSCAIKGKRQLFWSHGLKKKVGIGEMSDQEIAEKNEDDALLIASLSLEDWKVITRNYLQSELLDVTEEMGLEGIKLFLKRWRNVDLSEPEDETWNH